MKIPASPVQHVQDQYLEFLTALGVSADPLEWDLGPWPSEREWQRTFKSSIQRPIASIVVATSKPEKDWFPMRWAEVADALHEQFGMQVVLVGGKSERELAAERIVMDQARHMPRSELGSGLRRLVSILDASALVLSPDTGPLHMAVALERPVISLMGYTNPKRTGPYRRFHDLIVDAYGDPGENYPISMENRPGRMKRIGTRDVLDKMALWKERYAAKTR
jgi:heptosyltransferase I